tara:strand:+ start:86 stop:1831 length:1746 start_codon:yes stop_codon:yes gene_type:complete
MSFTINRDLYLKKFNQEIEISDGSESLPVEEGKITQLQETTLRRRGFRLRSPSQAEPKFINQGPQPQPQQPEYISESSQQGQITQLQDTNLITRESQQQQAEPKIMDSGLHLHSLERPQSISLDRPFDSNINVEVDPKLEYPISLKKSTLLEMWEYSQLAYDRKIDTSQELYTSWVIRGINESVEGQQIRGGDPNIYTNAMCRVFSFPDKLIFAFKGTDIISVDSLMGDVLSDLQVEIDNLSLMGANPNNPNIPHDNLGIVHQGFNRFVNSLFPELLQTIQNHPDIPFIFLGHSLGSISALIAGYRLYIETGLKPERIYQFGSPMGITTFGSIGSILDIINVIHTHDIVPNFMSIYNHHGTKIVIDIHNNYKVYQRDEHIPFIYKEPDTTKAYLVKKNFNIKDVSWDNYFQGRGSAFTSFFNTVENIKSLWNAFQYPLLQKSRDRSFEIVTEYGGISAHTEYREHIENALPDDILLPSFDLDGDIREVFRKKGSGVEYNPRDKSRYKFKPIDGVYTDNKEYITSHDTHHIYRDKTTNEISIINQRKGQIKNRVLTGNTNPLGLYFYENDEDIFNKVVMFKT